MPRRDKSQTLIGRHKMSRPIETNSFPGVVAFGGSGHTTVYAPTGVKNRLWMN